MIAHINEITKLDDSCIKSALAYIDPITLSNIIETINEDDIKNKILNNLSDETKKKLSLQNNSFIGVAVNKEEIINSFIAIINRVLNFR
jgi:hypothetical protein